MRDQCRDAQQEDGSHGGRQVREGGNGEGGREGGYEGGRDRGCEGGRSTEGPGGALATIAKTNMHRGLSPGTS